MAFQILCLSGGGYLGLYTAAVLEGIEARAGRPLADMFDMIIGTSVGGIIGLGLSAGTSAANIREAFEEDGPKIFSRRRPPRSWAMSGLRVLTGVASARYDSLPLREVIERVVGKDKKMGDLRRPTLVPAVNLTKGGARIFKTGHHETFTTDWQRSVVDVALATSAAPTYFPLHRIGDELFADGGTYANSPDMIGVHEAVHFLGQDREDLHVLSVGTTTSAFAFSASTRLRLGSFGWMKNERLPTVMIGCQQAMANDMMRHMLPGRYVRIDRDQSPDQRKELALDCASDHAKRVLRSMAAGSIMETSADPTLRAMLAHTAPPFAFLNAR